MSVRLPFFAFISIAILSGPLQAQDAGPWRLPVGSGPGQVGLIDNPNEACRGPKAISPAADGKLAILDTVNKKIVIAGGNTTSDIPLPSDLIEPTDFLATARGYVVADALGDVVLIDPEGAVRNRTKVAHNPEAGAIRLLPTPEGRLYVEELTGVRLRVDMSPDQLGGLVAPGLAMAATYEPRGAGPSIVILRSATTTGPLASMTFSSPIRITAAHILWAREGEGALVAIRERQLPPEEATFVRLETLNAEGIPTGETYIGPEAFGCDTRRPFTRLTDGRVISLSFQGDQAITVDHLTFVPAGTAARKALGQNSDSIPTTEDNTVFSELERMNGTSAEHIAALPPISPSQILVRAEAAIELKWTLSPTNYSHSGVPNLCNPPTHIWRRPHRLEGKSGQEIVAMPYRWGGYVSKLDTFISHLKSGRLAGDICTCRNYNCVHPDATGQDCSGFVSYAWQTGQYFTTSSLPKSSVSFSIQWDDLAPGDIVNRSGRHVRLVESIISGPNGALIKVIESASNERCGGVCRDTYKQSELEDEKYKPLRRLALTN